jgi:hypothetical protein
LMNLASGDNIVALARNAESLDTEDDADAETPADGESPAENSGDAE